MQQSIMLFFLNIANPILDFLANLSSVVGEQTFVIAVILFIYYNMDKKKGFKLYASVLFSVIAMGVIKAIVRAPRPFQVLESIEGKRLETATGYSFPSGHTTTAASFYSALALAFRKRTLSIICAILIALVGLSRLYLGVHWPIDVFGGLVLGIMVSLLFSEYLDTLYETESAAVSFATWFGIVTFIAGLAMAVLLDLRAIDETAFTDLMKALALGTGGFFGYLIEHKKVDFVIEASWKKRILRYIAGLAGVLLLMSLKAIIPDAIYATGAFVRYLLVGLWATGLFPLIGRGLRLFDGSR